MIAIFRSGGGLAYHWDGQAEGRYTAHLSAARTVGVPGLVGYSV